MGKVEILCSRRDVPGKCMKEISRPGTHMQESLGDGDRDRGSRVRSLSPSQAGRRVNTSRGLRFLGVSSVFVSIHLAGSQSFCPLDTRPESLATAGRH